MHNILNLISELESKGAWEEALSLTKKNILARESLTSNDFHILGRIYQRLGSFIAARKAYEKALEIKSFLPRTINNLILLELNLFNINSANIWLNKALKIKSMTIEEQELIYNSACDLKLFQLLHNDALEYINKSLKIRKSVISLCNKSICLQKLNKLDEAINIQVEAVRLQLELNSPQIINKPIYELVKKQCGDLEETIKLQIILMNLGILILTKDPFNLTGLKLIQAGMSYDREYWTNPQRSKLIWDGSSTKKLILWDDQGYGDTIQNLAWVNSASLRTESLELWLRPSLIKLVKERFILPKNCVLKSLKTKSIPKSYSAKNLGLFFLPFILEEWKNYDLRSYYGCLKNKRDLSSKSKYRVGLVWSAGKHSSPQPERNARIRDIPFKKLWSAAISWKEKYNLDLISLQLTGHDDQIIKQKINSGLLEKGLNSNDWLATSKVLESLDIVISVDTSIAHLAGAMGIPCILMLSCPADWRWGQDNLRTFIYQSFYICRCNKPNNWDNAIEQANLSLKQIIE